MKDIPGYEGLYGATEDGRIWSHPKKWARTGHEGKFLKTTLIGHGYQVVTLYDRPYNDKKFLVHRLVAMTYLPNPENLPEVNHKNGERLDNKPANLEWCTSKYNKRHGWKNRLYTHNKVTAKEVREIRKMYKQGFFQSTIATDFGITQGNVSSIVRRATWSHIR